MNYRAELKKIKAFLFDVDGVFSKEFVVFDKGELYRIMNARDGFAVRRAIEKGFKIGIITGGTSASVKERFEILGVEDIYLGSRETKVEKAKEFCNKYRLNLETDVLYMGDDLPDYELMKIVAFSACPADAVVEIQEISKYISDIKGGKGCVRDIIEQVLKIQNLWY